MLLLYLARREGIRLFDLGNYSRKRWLRDVLIGLGLFVPYFLIGAGVPVAILMAISSVGNGGPPPVADLPMWEMLYSLIIWPVIWSFTEDNTYLGYSLPRLEVLTGRKWLAVVVVWFFLALQHAFVPFPLDWRLAVAWFVGVVPVTVFYCWVYFRLGRLLPIHVAHWLTDVVGFSVRLLQFPF